MLYKVQEYSIDESSWHDVGTLNYIDNSDNISLTISLSNIKQEVFMQINEKYEALCVEDRLIYEDNNIYSKSFKKNKKRKFEISNKKVQTGFSVNFENAYYSKAFPLIFCKLDKSNSYKCFNNFINKYFEIHIKYLGNNEFQINDKVFDCEQYYCYQSYGKENEGSNIYLDANGLIAMVNNKTRIIHERR